MRATLVGALLLVWVTSALGCADAHSPCGSGGTFVADSDTEHCVYSLALPIVIEGGFECPSAMPFELDLNTHRVCSDRPFDRQAMPPALCARMPELCSAPEAPPALPEPAMAAMMGRPDPGGPANDSRPPAAARPAVTWTDCNSRTLEEGTTGDRCDPGIGGCGTCAPGTRGCASETCSVTAAVCDPEGILKVSEKEIIECAERAASAADGARVFRGAEDCEAALTEGHSFQACEGSFLCARRTEEPCCLEYALCNTDTPVATNLLVRYRFCERGCADVKPDKRREPITDCGAFVNELTGPENDFESADLPCEGDFVCWGGDDLSDGHGADVDFTTANALTEQLHWCSEGVVRGQHSTTAPVFFPMGPPSP